jgi:hypothetical protein
LFAGDALHVGAFVEIQLMTEQPQLASGVVAEVYEFVEGQQPLVQLQTGEVGAVRITSVVAGMR